MAALYQQARPITFEQVIGQEHVKDLLIAALQKGRIGHAYLFSGPRGVGKTTTARLLAMAVNCSNPKTKPCGECESCLLVRQASHPDVIELDAASNNSVEDIRDLREKVNLASIRGGSRVWILDEAHMLTKSAANALLKTLEEPPSNLVFILATTEPEKLPPTILSRCQHYRFRRLSEAEIGGKLQSLCDAAKIEAEDEAIALIARAADGAMRDGESLLERLLSQEKTITRQDAEEALGLPPQERIEALATHLMDGKLQDMFAEASSLYRDGFAPRTLAERLKMSLRDAVYTKLKIDGYSFELKNPENDILKIIHALDEESDRFTRYNDLFSLEVALIKAHNSLNDNEPGTGEVIVTHANPNQPTVGAVRQTTPETKSTSSTVADFNPNAKPGARASSTPPPAQQQSSSPSGKTANWNDVKKRASAQLKAFLLPGKVTIEGSIITINFNEARHTFHFNQLKSRRDELRELVDDVLGKGYTLQLNGEGGNLTLKPDAADQAAGVTPQIIQEAIQPQTKPKNNTEVSEPEVSEPVVLEPEVSQGNLENTDVDENTEIDKDALITTIKIEASEPENISTSPEKPQAEKRSIKAPDTIPDDNFFDAKKIRNSNKQALTAIPENDSIKLDDLDVNLPNTETENESLPGDFWGEDVGSAAPPPTPRENKSAVNNDLNTKIETETKPDKANTSTAIIDTKVIETKTTQNNTTKTATKTATKKAKAEATGKAVDAKTQKVKEELLAKLQKNKSNLVAEESDEEVDDSELAVKARLEQLQVLFPGEMSFIETFDKSEDTDIDDTSDNSFESTDTDSK